MDRNKRIERAMSTLVVNVDSAEVTADLASMSRKVPFNNLSESMNSPHLGRGGRS